MIYNIIHRHVSCRYWRYRNIGCRGFIFFFMLQPIFDPTFRIENVDDIFGIYRLISIWWAARVSFLNIGSKYWTKIISAHPLGWSPRNIHVPPTNCFSIRFVYRCFFFFTSLDSEENEKCICLTMTCVCLSVYDQIFYRKGLFIIKNDNSAFLKHFRSSRVIVVDLGRDLGILNRGFFFFLIFLNNDGGL